MTFVKNPVKISIIMPVYNDEDYLNEAIDSILKQTLKDIEVICVNDGSTDNSLKILNDYSSRHDFIKVFSKENEGSGIARNYALTKATGEFIAYLDSDDIFIDERALELMYDSAIKNNASMVSANLLGVGLKGQLVVNRNLERFKEEGIITPQEYGIPYSFYKNIFDREFLLENNIAFPDLLRGQDPVFLAEIFTLVDEIPTVPVDLYGFRYPKTSGYLRINTHRKKYDYIMHFKQTFDILDNAGFDQMKENYTGKLVEFINADHNSYTKEIKDIVYDVFKDDEHTLNLVKDLFSNPKISVIVPVYNASKFLHESISSVLNQSIKEIELICVNDGSEDNSLEILEELYQNDSRIRIINQENAGCGAARNRALEEVCGDYIYFFDPDDYISENAFKEMYDNILSNDSDFVIFKIANFREGEEIDYSLPGFGLDNVFTDMEFDNFTFTYKDVKRYVLNASFAPWTKFYKREFLDQYDDFRFPTDIAFDDVPFHVQSMLRASRVSFVPKFLYFYRFNPDSIINTSSNGFHIFEICDIVERFLKKENHFDEFSEEFKLFKITQINNYMMSTDSEEYFQRAKKEFSEISLGDNHIIRPDLLKRYELVLQSDSFIEYKPKEYDLRIEEFTAERDILKKQSRKLKKENKRLKKELSKQKELQEKILSSNSWKATEYFRKSANFLRKIKIESGAGNKQSKSQPDSQGDVGSYNKDSKFDNLEEYKLLSKYKDDVDELIHMEMTAPDRTKEESAYREIRKDLMESDLKEENLKKMPIELYGFYIKVLNNENFNEYFKFDDGLKTNHNYVNKKGMQAEIDNFTENGLNTEKRDERIIVSLTSFPERMRDIHFCLYSLLTQNLKPDEVVLWLANEQFPNKEKDVPESVLKLKGNGLTIRWCKDIKSYKKLIFILKENQNDIIVTADDDIYYPKDWLEKMWNTYLDHPHTIISSRTRFIARDSDNKILDYSNWDFCDGTNKSSFLNFPTGAGGIMYFPGALSEKVFDEDAFMRLCPTADDIWFWAMAVLNHTKITCIDGQYDCLNYVNVARETGAINNFTLWNFNKTGKNDAQLKNVLDEFPDILEIIDND